MADISADSLLPAGEFRFLKYYGPMNIASGVTGDIATITAPAGKRVRLNLMNVSSGNQAGISVIADGVTIVDELTLNVSTSFSPGAFNISPAGLPYVDASTSIIIRKNAGNTTQSINYAFSEGF